MQKTILKNILSIFVFVILALIGGLCVSAKAEVVELSYNQVEDNAKVDRVLTTAPIPNGIVFSFKNGSTTISNTSPFTTTYQGQDIVIEATLDMSSVTTNGAITYSWLFNNNEETQNDVDLYSITGQTDLMLTIRNVAHSGYYILRVSDENGVVGESLPIKITITKAILTITEATPKQKQYDGSNLIEFDFVQSTTFVGEDSGVANIVLTGLVSSCDVGEGKLVSSLSAKVDKDDIKDNYAIELNFNTNNISTNIVKKSVVLNYTFPQNAVYNGKSYASLISIYYTDVTRTRVSVGYKYAFESSYGGSEYKADLINAGVYQIIPLKNASDNNYSFYLDDTFTQEITSLRFTIGRAQPVFTFTKSEFTYNGTQQDVKNYVLINNNEQTIKFKGTTTFITYAQGKEIEGKVKVYVDGSANYSASGDIGYNFTVSKAPTQFDLTNVKTEYEYTSTFITLDLSGLVINNDEQEVEASVDDFVNVGSYYVRMQSKESDNYKATVVNDLYVHVVKKQIDVSNLEWKTMNNLVFESGRTYTASLLSCSAFLTPIYEGNFKESQAGTYVAKVSYQNNNPENVEVIGSTKDLVWKIDKRSIIIPNVVGERNFVYDTQEKGLSFDNLDNNFVTIINNAYTNVGNYTTSLILSDTNNTKWNNNNKEVITFDWKITKQVISLGEFDKAYYFTNSQKVLNIPENDAYYVVGDKATDAGEYTAYVILKDSYNYTFDNDLSVIKVDWKIISKSAESRSPVVAIIITSLIILSLAIFVTLQFTVVRHKRASKKIVVTGTVAQKDDIRQNITEQKPRKTRQKTKINKATKSTTTTKTRKTTKNKTIKNIDKEN